MKPLSIIFTLLLYISQASLAIADPSFPKAHRQDSNPINLNPSPNEMLLIPFNWDDNTNPRKKVSNSQEGKWLKKKLSAEEAAYLAFLDTFYYRIERWIPIFEERIIFLESATQNVETQLELMKYYFNLGGIMKS